VTAGRGPEQTARLERVVGRVLRGGVIASTACLSVGLLLSLFGVGSSAAFLLNAGIVILLATPVSRVVVSTVEYIVERDWAFATLTIAVLLELVAGAGAARVLKPQI
jgi:uncharacterized membrane protein